MLRIPRRYSHFVYGVIQSGLTCAIATGIANVPFLAAGSFVIHWLQSWFVAWIRCMARPAARGSRDVTMHGGVRRFSRAG
jgi:hypothetical protein